MNKLNNHLMNRKKLFLCTIMLCCSSSIWAQPLNEQRVQDIVDQQFKPLLEQYKIPGLAVGVTLNGQHYFVNYGVASKQNQQPVSNSTLFELGSVSKTFNATLAGYAQATAKLSLSDHPATYFPELKNTAVNRATLLNLGTYTAGGFPLQFPDEVVQPQDMLKYFQTWKTKTKIGAARQYSNPSIGLMGYVTALAMKKSYTELIEKTLFPQLGMTQSFIDVPEQQMSHYAWGYKNDQPIRVSAGMFDAEAYGVKSSSSDMLKFLDAQINSQQLKTPMRKAIEHTHVGYFKVGAMTQGLGWEQYHYPVKLETLLQGNSSKMALQSHVVTPIKQPKIAPATTWFNKTGATNGFASYVAFIPQQKIGIVMLANTNFPNEARIKASYQVVQQLIQANSAQ
ncbi:MULTISPECIES: class C beta-lactamase [unclassified Acinetobacter]|uniref:class C beta-lactamase n=1 Tax=unclassified Acinetobacter TaxID=196816 RepID=UPI00244D5FD7|nr:MULTISPECIES: class C beta-lactamase [unclassified Acinetobacter]MDH0032688.1 beta-lactamase [Acinetobacter sp. GD04021]MDH0888123.1 beta-lactamase [Acinetobacter sp. GD03873]MDH1084474.1 beta-lactamase [Acinetobacter sp. GD03983]MDH2191440.1 beta-lactamase [Acinetobacter sp. GD03645]MDH2205013.1 beta-lactamase [Acinetobacter sp. GD03647]